MKKLDSSFVDVHIHLADSAYGHNVEALLEIARKENVLAIVANSMDLETSNTSLTISVSNPSFVYAAVGVHPWNAQTVRYEELDQIERLVEERQNRIIAIGEIGLDKSYAKTPENFERQRQFFERQLSLAEKMRLPVIVHSRSSAKEVLDTLNSYQTKEVLMHWYSGPLEYIKEICDRGWTLSFGPSIFYSNRIREIVSKASLGALLTETDGPVKYRGPFEGRETTPEFVRTVVEEVARILKSDPRSLAEQIFDNFCRFFQAKRESN